MVRSTVTHAGAVVCLTLLAPGCQRWFPYEPVRISGQGTERVAVLQHALEAVERLGYEPEVSDADYFAFRVYSRITGKFAFTVSPYGLARQALDDDKAASWFEIRILHDGTTHIEPRGKYVDEEDHEIHKKVLPEWDEIRQALGATP